MIYVLPPPAVVTNTEPKLPGKPSQTAFTFIRNNTLRLSIHSVAKYPEPRHSDNHVNMLDHSSSILAAKFIPRFQSLQVWTYTDDIVQILWGAEGGNTRAL